MVQLSPLPDPGVHKLNRAGSAPVLACNGCYNSYIIPAAGIGGSAMYFSGNSWGTPLLIIQGYNHLRISPYGSSGRLPGAGRKRGAPTPQYIVEVAWSSSDNP